ncbi:MAG TPA: MOSC and FAD-binding oxidoreductase domain-containing protein [Kofleriaceae bacterium]
MARLLSVSVGLPRDIEWKGRVVHTGVWKTPVRGRCPARRLNLDGDGQGDLVGHGGEHRAVFVYQLESYGYWQARLDRRDFVSGQFGENFTVEGLPDDAVCIGDQYQIGSAVFEVSQPRTTCYRVGIRMNDPQIPALLTSSGRPGFYMRVLREGDVGAGDQIVKVGQADDRMTVAEINALLYSPNHPHDQLARAVALDALAPGWRRSFDALLHQAGSGNAGLAPREAAHPAASGFRALTVATIDRDADDVLSLTMTSADRRPLAAALPGQYVVLRLRDLYRSYSLSGPASTERYRISVKLEPHGAAGEYLRDHLRAGDALGVSSPRGSFVLEPGERSVLLISAGIGATPVLAMLYALAAARSTREVVWVHGARDGGHHPFAAETRRLVGALARGRSCVCYSQPRSSDALGRDFDAHGRVSRATLEELAVPNDADVYLCGPQRFMTDLKGVLASLGIANDRIRVELFTGSEPAMPGVVGFAARAPHRPHDDADSGPVVSFARSGIAAHWNATGYQSILELAEACDVPVRWSCRTGVCHSCECGLISGDVVYGPAPLDDPARGNLLVCCSRPTGDVVIDL